MERTNYKGFVIDRDNLGRVYIYNTSSKFSEDFDRKYLTAADYFNTADSDLTDLQAAKKMIDLEVSYFESAE